MIKIQRIKKFLSNIGTSVLKKIQEESMQHSWNCACWIKTTSRGFHAICGLPEPMCSLLPFKIHPIYKNHTIFSPSTASLNLQPAIFIPLITFPHRLPTIISTQHTKTHTQPQYNDTNSPCCKSVMPLEIQFQI